MATLVFSAVGTLLGGPLGGAVGALVGRQVDTGLLAGRRQGPRLKELAATTSTYGAIVPRHFGCMRVAGSIVWATDLVEHSETEGGKGGPAVTSYSYTASFAVALASRRVARVGRIWADGNLLRGAAGDMKVDGTMRFYTGDLDQAADPLIAAAEGVDRCPAYRGLAYVVFEDLALADFYNRIPTLTFEVFADDGDVSLQAVADAAVADVDAGLTLDGIAGLSCEGPLADILQLLDPLFPMDCDASGDLLTIARERLQDAPVMLDEAAVTVDDDGFGASAGYARKRAPPAANPPQVLRYYDVGRDYLPGVQRALGQALPGDPETVELPAAMAAGDARDLAQSMARRADWSRETLAWRTAELDPDVAPGTIVTVPAQPGRWRVSAWEWRDSGVELALTRVAPSSVEGAVVAAVDPGRAQVAMDLAAPATLLTAFELPWDGSGSGDAPRVFAAVSASRPSWRGAALFVDSGDGNLRPLGPSGRIRSVVGLAEGPLAAASPQAFDRANSVVVTLADTDMTLVNADGRQLAEGANQALLGAEIIQFANATALGGARWRLSTLLRGRGGTEAAVDGHHAGEAFVLLDGRATALAADAIGSTATATILASGFGDSEPVTSGIALPGITRRPLAPCHPEARWLSDGGLTLGWTRRARGAWRWDDGVEVPLNEDSESYQVTFGPADAPLASWQVRDPQIALDAATIATLRTMLPGGSLRVRQGGASALSDPLILAMLT